ncbi:FK506-binding protein 5 [Pistacia vera]|uniref:FK506-binding protein 5 n=1 Tax=Pistacia vera TaxID=55513 RepID=UPI001262FF33|nr:FK506-binding protein 5 [Pistacia vera]
MEGSDDFESFSLIEAPSSPVPERKLKRLKKAKTLVENSPKFEALNFNKSNIQDSEQEKLQTLDLETSTGQDEFETLDSKISNIHCVKEGELETLDLEKSTSQDLEESNSGSQSGLEVFEDENGLDSGADSLSMQEDVSGAKRTLKFDSLSEEFDGRSQDQFDVMEMEKEKESEDMREDYCEKKRLHSDAFGDKKDKKKRVKSVGDDEKPKSTVVLKRTAKERREQLKQLRAESQRLLRETRDAAFKSVPLVQKPISSVLEKIRQRKLEASKKSLKLSKTSFIDDDDDGDDDDDDILREVGVKAGFEIAHNEDRGDEKSPRAVSEKAIPHPADVESSLGVFFTDASNSTAHPSSHEIIPPQMAVDEEPKQAFRAPIDDTQDLFADSQISGSKDELPDEKPNSPLEEVLAPSLLALNLKLDSVLPEDDSEEEDNDKENINPSLEKLDGLSLSPNGDPVKAFVDDEAEEEDDSDNDLLRFQDNEEDEDIDDVEELKDMIATEYKEKPIDTERRNELHQKWLEQQDEAGTEKLLQRFKCGSKEIEKTLLEEEEEKEEESEEDNDEFGNEDTEDVAPANVVRMNLRKVKEMIPQMFTDKDDAYISSDDEETEKSIVKQCLFEKSEEQASFLSPAEDKDSKEVFSLIKKLNIVPDSRRRVKASGRSSNILSSFFSHSDDLYVTKFTSLSEMLLIGHKAVSSKPSFLGRGASHSLPLPKKHGSSMMRSFIFERDDSNSKSTISVSEGSSETIQRENQPTKTASTRLYNSQIKSSTQNTKAAAQMKSGTALFEILRRSSLQSSQCTQDSVANYTESVLATFRLQKPIKKEPNMSTRTL